MEPIETPETVQPMTITLDVSQPPDMGEWIWANGEVVGWQIRTVPQSNEIIEMTTTWTDTVNGTL